MNRTKIKNYAPQARRDFLQAVKDRAASYGLTAGRIDPVTIKGDVALIAGRAFPKSVDSKRKALQERVERDGYEPVMEALAYTWFNRLVAIRYMQLHGYLEHGYRVLSPSPHRGEGARRAGEGPAPTHRREGETPEILEHVEHVELPDLKRDPVIELKLDGAKEAEHYRTLLVAQCNALHAAMPFLYERIGDETELVLPENLLQTDSIVRKLVSGIDEDDWHEVEIIGCLYEAYISERYEQVIDKVAVADSLGPSRGEQPRDTIRRYLAAGFFKHHLQTYKRRPIYWLFSSGKLRAFQCLVYLHRYHEGTLAQMRTEYVIPLQGKLASRIDQLAGDITKATSTSHRNALTKERDKLIKQQAELLAYDEKLRHFADMRISLNLDDGVKVNYGKFGDLLAEVKAVTGGKDEE